MTTLETIHARNAAFVDRDFAGPMELRPALGATVIGCLDPRVDPAHVLGLHLGDAPVIRNVGGRATPAVIGILDLLALGFPAQLGSAREQDRGDLIVLHHTRCGITRMAGHPDQLAAYFGIDVADLPAKAVGDPRASLAVDVAVLSAHPGIATAYRVTGILYDVRSGLIEQLTPAAVAS